MTPAGENGRAVDGASETAQTASTIRRRAWTLGGAAVAMAGLCAFLWISVAHQMQEVADRTERTQRIAGHARAIAEMRFKPRTARETALERTDLLARVTKAMRASNLPAGALISTLPQPERRLNGSEHIEMVNRLVFEGLKLRALTEFCRVLLDDNPQLHISGLHIRASADRRWNADVNVGYLVVRPDNDRPT